MSDIVQSPAFLFPHNKTKKKKKKSMHTTNPKITEIKSNIRQKTAPPPTLALKAGAVRWFEDLVKRSSGSNALQTETCYVIPGLDLSSENAG